MISPWMLIFAAVLFILGLWLLSPFDPLDWLVPGFGGLVSLFLGIVFLIAASYIVLSVGLYLVFVKFWYYTIGIFLFIVALLVGKFYVMKQRSG